MLKLSSFFLPFPIIPIFGGFDFFAKWIFGCRTFCNFFPQNCSHHRHSCHHRPCRNCCYCRFPPSPPVPRLLTAATAATANLMLQVASEETGVEVVDPAMLLQMQQLQLPLPPPAHTDAAPSTPAAAPGGPDGPRRTLDPSAEPSGWPHESGRHPPSTVTNHQPPTATTNHKPPTDSAMSRAVYPAPSKIPGGPRAMDVAIATAPAAAAQQQTSYPDSDLATHQPSMIAIPPSSTPPAHIPPPPASPVSPSSPPSLTLPTTSVSPSSPLPPPPPPPSPVPSSSPSGAPYPHPHTHPPVYSTTVALLLTKLTSLPHDVRMQIVTQLGGQAPDYPIHSAPLPSSIPGPSPDAAGASPVPRPTSAGANWESGLGSPPPASPAAAAAAATVAAGLYSSRSSDQLLTLGGRGSGEAEPSSGQHPGSNRSVSESGGMPLLQPLSPTRGAQGGGGAAAEPGSPGSPGHFKFSSFRAR